MPPRYSPAKRLAGVALANLLGINKAARVLGVEERTVAAWVAAAPSTDDDEQAWRAAQALAQERMLTGLAKGDARGLTAWATAAGIASRNVRYSQLIARREARRAEEQAEPVDERPAWHAALDALDVPRASLFGAELRHELGRRTEDEDPGPPQQREDGDEEAMLAYLQTLAAMSDDAVLIRLLELEPEWSAHPGYSARRILMDAIDSIDEPPETPEPVPAPPQPPPPLQATPGPSQRLVAPPEPRPALPYGLHVVSDAERDDPNDYGHPSWRSEQ